MSEHVPAWKRFQIKGSDEGKKVEDELDSLIVSTHLSTGSLSKKEKKRIIQGHKGDVGTTNKVSKKSKDRKREKLAKEERLKKKQVVLKDQLRYLINFYTMKLELELPEAVKELPSVKENIALQAGGEEEEQNTVKEVWKFSKQKQNWLIKHFTFLDEIPAEFDPLMVKYFKDLQGGSKEQLQKSCLEIVNRYNECMEKQKEEMAKIVLGEAETDKKGDAKDADKDESSEETKEDFKEQTAAEKKDEILPPSKDLLKRACSMLDAWNIQYQLVE